MLSFLKEIADRQPFTVPLFPLRTVLFPGGLLPLKVFEQRYIEMTKACLRDEAPFGVCLIREGRELGAGAAWGEAGRRPSATALVWLRRCPEKAVAVKAETTRLKRLV